MRHALLLTIVAILYAVSSDTDYVDAELVNNFAQEAKAGAECVSPTGTTHSRSAGPTLALYGR
jgi:hypothetical protein